MFDTLLSNFEFSRAGWTTSGDAQNLILTTDATGNGVLQADDAQLGDAVWYFFAPPPYLGNQTDKIGGTLSYDIAQVSSGAGIDAADVIFTQGGTADTLTVDFDVTPGATLTRFSVSLVAASSTAPGQLIFTDAGTGDSRPATEEDIRNVLGFLAFLEIRGEYAFGSDRAQIDNIRLTSAPADAGPAPGPEPEPHPDLSLTIIGSNAADSLSGAAGDDRIDGRGGDDSIDGGPGDDTLIAASGLNDIAGGSGDDRIVTGLDADLIFGGAGNDVVKSGEGDDDIELGDGNDQALSGEGDDIVTASGGDNVIKTGDGADLVETGGGEDVILTGEGDDLVVSGAGRDVVKTSLGADSVEAGAGDDFVSGWRGDDTIDGGAGDDVLRGDFDDDVIEGGAGNDRIVAGPGRDTLIFRPGFEEDRILDFRSGSDLLDFSRHDGVNRLGDLVLSQIGDNTVLEDREGGRIVLADIGLDGLDFANDFVFV